MEEKSDLNTIDHDVRKSDLDKLHITAHDGMKSDFVTCCPSKPMAEKNLILAHVAHKTP